MENKNLKTEQVLENDNFYFGKIPEDWEWKTVDEIKKDKKALVSGPFGSNIGKRFFRPMGVPVIRGNNLKQDKFIDSGFVFVDDEKADELKNCTALEDDIIFTAAGTIGQVGIIPKNGKYSKYIISNKQLRLRINTDVLSPLFAFYWFSSKKMQGYLINNNVGSALPLLTLRELKNVPIPIPSILEQNKISEILNNFYEKIQHLQNQNKILDRIAQAIFKSWFIDFDGIAEFEDSEIGQIPKGWTVGKINSVCETFGGGTPSTTNPDYWNGDVCWLVPRDLTNSDRLFCISSERRITDLGLKNCSSQLHPENSIFMTSRATIGVFAINRIPVATNQGFIVIRPNNPNHLEYLYLNFLNRVGEFINNANGSTFLELSRGNFRELPILIPSLDSLDDFHDEIKSFFDMRFENEQMIELLSKTRDILLPKLMSGEIRV